MARFKPAAGQDSHKRCAAVINPLGIVLDHPLSLDTHVTTVCRSSYYQLRQLRPIAKSLSVEAAKSLVQAFISSRLDYCHAILHGLLDRLMWCLQSVQNSAARLITGAPRCDHITPILWQLHWLPVRRHVDLKIAVLVFQCLTGQAPCYLTEDCQLVADISARRLRSADTSTCITRHPTSSATAASQLPVHGYGMRCQSI